LKKDLELSIAGPVRNHRSPKANKSRGSSSPRSSEWRAKTVFQQTASCCWSIDICTGGCPASCVGGPMTCRYERVEGQLRVQNLGPREGKDRGVFEESSPQEQAELVRRAKTGRRNPSDLAGACSGGKFVVSGSGEAYDAQARVQIGKSGFNVSDRGTLCFRRARAFGLSRLRLESPARYWTKQKIGKLSDQTLQPEDCRDLRPVANLML